ncbi:MAG TPA: hypothetical protein VFK13_16160 [Gemmatimonadaceae bacterium]|nr:hypothetical protein [Gemmatimonadaceae bacterium]
MKLKRPSRGAICDKIEAAPHDLEAMRAHGGQCSDYLAYCAFWNFGPA